MLREIINFTRSLSPDSFKLNLQPKEGLHIQIELDESGDLHKDKSKSMLFRKKDELVPFLQDCLSLQVYTIWVSSNKPLDPDQKIHSCSPFCVAFKKLDKKNQVNLLENQPQFQKSLKKYFERALSFCETDEQKKWAKIFSVFCKNELTDFVKSLGCYSDLKKEDYIYVYLMNASLEEYRQTHDRYLTAKVFNTEKFNKTVNDVTYGVSDYLTGYNTKKPFLQHHTATFSINSRVTSDDALQLFKFSQLKANGQLPNPLPIFIEKEELNDEVVKIFNRDAERKINYSEIIRSVYDRTHDLGNYYLLNIQGSDLKDFDFVSSFRYEIFDMRVLEVIPIGGTLDNIQLRTIFDFERKIVRRIFNGCLVSTFEDSITVNYFFDFESQRNRKKATSLKKRAGIGAYQMTLKYRKAFYDYIYKSRLEALNSRIIYEVMSTIILDEVKHDELVNHKHSKEFAIKEKLNIWFSLFEYFDQQKTEGGDDTMASQVLELQGRMQQIANESDAHVENDNEFAYAAGQVIYYLLNQSEAGNKSHALLEPFLQKTDANQLRTAIARTFAQYKHAITFYKGRFEKLMAEVLSYDLDGDMKSLLPMILSGYFADCVIYQKN